MQSADSKSLAEEIEARAKSEGAGPGLSIVREIVEGHGGRVEVESSVGKWSAFTVRITRDKI